MTGLSNLLNSEDLLNAPLKTIEQSSDQDSTKGTITPTRTLSSIVTTITFNVGV